MLTDSNRLVHFTSQDVLNIDLIYYGVNSIILYKLRSYSIDLLLGAEIHQL